MCFLFVASYESQGYGGGILTRLHTGLWHICILRSHKKRPLLGNSTVTSRDYVFSIRSTPLSHSSDKNEQIEELLELLAVGSQLLWLVHQSTTDIWSRRLAAGSQLV
jgi:hypothetical protein